MSTNTEQQPKKSGTNTPTTTTNNSTNKSNGSNNGKRSGNSHQLQQSDLNKVVIEYLTKKGYSQTEQIFRVESARTMLVPEADKIVKGVTSGKRDYWGNIIKRSFNDDDYVKVFERFKDFVEGSLMLYRDELIRLLFPIYIYVFLKILNIENKYNTDDLTFETCLKFLKKHQDLFIIHKEIIQKIYKEISDAEEDEIENKNDNIEEENTNLSANSAQANSNLSLKKKKLLSIKQLYEKCKTIKAWRMNKYQVHITQSSMSLAIYHLIDQMSGVAENNLGILILGIINESINPVIVSKDEVGELSLEDKLIISSEDEAENLQRQENDEINSNELKLTADPLDPTFQKEVEFELKDDSELLNIFIGEMKKIQEEHEKEIKENPNLSSSLATNVIPLPPKTSQNLKSEIEKVINLRQQLSVRKYSNQTNAEDTGIKIPTPSICLFTFQNTNENVSCMRISPDCKFIATGDLQSQIFLYQLDQRTPLTSDTSNNLNKNIIDASSGKYQLTAHSGPVYSMDFTPCGKYLVSCSYDSTIKIWSLQLGGIPLVSYKSHNGPIWDVKCNPNGFYFASAGSDMTVRVWSFDHIYALRLLVGHISDVSCVEWHTKNSKYLFSGSLDKTVRMWDISDGSCVRIFVNAAVITTGVTAIKCSNDGKTLIIGCEDGSLSVWDIRSSKLLKIMKGHGRNSILSLTLDYDDEILMSSGFDNSVRVWDLKNDSLLDPSVIEKRQKALNEGLNSKGSIPNSNSLDKAENDSDLLQVTNDAQQSLEQDLNLYGKGYTIKPTSDLLTCFYTKNTPVFDLTSMNGSNLFFATGPYTG
ncbi:Transcription initiation factor TFIID subunit 5 [Hanseniaspora uvarum DSM 2768]|nr:Transcription initiation factor TFIID subunit 5 [Hanseniaspora uvarum DSM 2768]